MNCRKNVLGQLVLLASLGAAATLSQAQELRFMCSTDGDECEVMDDLVTRFEQANEGVDITVDIVPYKSIQENLPVQLAAGSGPDIAKVTDLGGLSQYYLDITPYVDADYWEQSFGDILNWYRKSAEDKGIYGLHSQLTITGGYINRTLFDQAEVEPPSADASWEEWAEAVAKVAEATETPYLMAMDRSGHRIAGPAISDGAKLFADDGTPALVDEGFTRFVTKFVEWNNNGVMLRDVWAGTGGDTYQDAAQEFVSGSLVYYYSGSWQVGKFDNEIGDAFDWQVVGTPCGEVACSGMPGGAGIVGFSSTKHPEIVGKLLDYLAQEDIYAELTARTRNIPAHAAVAAKGVDYEGASAPAAAALNAWGQQVEKISPVAYAYQGYKHNRAMFGITMTRVSQAIVGELSIEEAMERATADLEQTMSEVDAK